MSTANGDEADAETREFFQDLTRKILRLQRNGLLPISVTVVCSDGENHTTTPVPARMRSWISPQQDSGEIVMPKLPPAPPRGEDDTQILLPELVEDLGDAIVPSARLPETTATDDAILGVLKVCDRPLKMVAIAKRANLAGNTYFSGRLKLLCETGKVLHLSGHLYWLTERGEPFPI